MKKLFLNIRNDFYETLSKEKTLFSEYHLEGDVWTHSMLVFNSVENSSNDNLYKVVALLHDLGKSLAREEINDKIIYRGHEGISTYLALKYKEDIERLGLDINEVLYTINYHGVLWRKSQKQIETYFAKDIDKLEKVKEFSKFDKKGNIYFKDKNEEINYNFKEKTFKETDKEIIMICGVPNSGKSTYIKNLNLPVLSRDNIVMELGNGLNYTDAWKIVNHNEVNKIFQNRMKELKKHNKFIIDLTNLSWKTRKQYFHYYNEYKFNVKFLMTDFETIHKRNIKRFIKEGKNIPYEVIINMMKKVELPLYNEGNISNIEIILN